MRTYQCDRFKKTSLFVPKEKQHIVSMQAYLMVCSFILNFFNIYVFPYKHPKVRREVCSPVWWPSRH